MGIVLPTEKVKGTRVNPEFCIISGFSKCGKTTSLSLLDDNLIIDLEKGTAYLDALKVDVDGIRAYNDVVLALRAEKKKYSFITIDTGTKLEDIAQELALLNYKATPIGKRFEGGARDIQNLANGLGWGLIREAYRDLLSWIKPFCDTLILVCHVKDSSLQKDGEEITMMDLDLTGKLKRMMAADAGAIGIMYRRKNQSILSFKGGDSFMVEARPEHLRGKEFVVLESDANNVVTANWSQIFI
jgi:hypothetical protein